ncbi:MAG: hypothetical protein E5X84_18800 [Mesorhizobium sp.]|nr:MAG: hypothetical protein E5X84_18800 [Mesorhizobium sp.]
MNNERILAAIEIGLIWSSASKSLKSCLSQLSRSKKMIWGERRGCGILRRSKNIQQKERPHVAIF